MGFLAKECDVPEEPIGVILHQKEDKIYFSGCNYAIPHSIKGIYCSLNEETCLPYKGLKSRLNGNSETFFDASENLILIPNYHLTNLGLNFGELKEIVEYLKKSGEQYDSIQKRKIWFSENKKYLRAVLDSKHFLGQRRQDLLTQLVGIIQHYESNLSAHERRNKPKIPYSTRKN